MNLVRCSNSHFYDKDKHGDNCPYCAQLAGNAEPQRPAPPQVKTPEPVRQPVAENPAPSMAETPAAPAIPEPTTATQSDAQSFVASEEDSDNCTVGYYSRVIGVEPVVGWLVCTEGDYRGESFKLKSGRNFIGRAANMDVVLSADHTISRFKHAAVIYEPRSRQFIVSAGESRELCYLNGEVVLSNAKMKAYDILNLGNTSLMLIPCCGDRFSWEDGVVADKKQE